MALDLSGVKYRLSVMMGNGEQCNIRDFVTNLGWEENKNEIATRISFTARNDNTSKGRLSSLIRPGCLVGIFATVGKRDEEVARGYVTSWNPQEQNSGEELKCTCYDVLYNLQKSQTNKFYPSGTGTKSIVTDLLNEWEIPLNGYNGPNVAHGKLKYNNSYVSDVLLDVLDDAGKKGAGKYIVRTEKGYADIVKRGSNPTVYVFRYDITKSISTSISTADLVTRVNVIGQQNDEGNSSVEATLNGLTEYGIRQRIYTRGADESLEDAKSAAQEILRENGSIKQEVILQSPDVPYIRKGDLVFVSLGVNNAYYHVTSIRHDCENYSMTMELEA